MKIQAKDVKVGMTVSWGVVTITVERIEPFIQKNGKTGRYFYGPAKRSRPRGMKPSHFKSYKINAKDNSWLILK